MLPVASSDRQLLFHWWEYIMLHVMYKFIYKTVFYGLYSTLLAICFQAKFVTLSCQVCLCDTLQAEAEDWLSLRM